MSYKKIIILSGGAGFGKTHIMNYIERRYYETIALTSGDYHKIKWGLERCDPREIPPLPPVLLTSDALHRYIFDNRHLGLARYERLKKENPERTTQQIIRFIEADRGVVPDFPARALLKLAACSTKNGLVTDVVRAEELAYLLKLVVGSGEYNRVFIAKLVCQNPYRAHAEVEHNRQEISYLEIANIVRKYYGSQASDAVGMKSYSYRLMESEAIADKIVWDSIPD
jgi:hypothetical protein